MRYISFSIATIRQGLCYKINYYSMILNTVFVFFIEYALWRSIYSHNNIIGGYTFNDMLIYLIVGNIVRRLLGSGIDSEFGKGFKSGKIVTDLVKPISLFPKELFSDLGRAFLESMTVGSVFFIFYFLSIGGIKLSVQRFIIFIIAILFAYVINFIICYISALLSFWTNSNTGVSTLKTAIWTIFSGTLLPLDFYPDWLKYISNILPFKYTYYVPISIIEKKQNMNFYIQGFEFQILWIIILSLIVYFMTKFALDEYAPQGG